MNDVATSLDNLRDIVEPAPVPWWPLAFGWWALTVVLVALGLVAVVKAAIRWQFNAYRRAALRELESADSDADVATILKRTALSVFPREQVASLSGTQWHQWLEQTGGQPLSGPVAERLSESVFACTESEKSPALQAFVANWIRTHRRPASC